jgi:peptide/nickel transport system permease protein
MVDSGASAVQARLESARVLRTPLAEGLRRFRQNPLSILGLVIIAFMLGVAAIGPFFIPYPEDVTGTVHIDRRLQPPSADHYFGTDEVGRDVFSRVVAGARISLGVGVIVLTVATAIGVSLGMLAGYFTGFIETLIMRVTDIFLTIPGLILAMAISAALGPSIPNVMLAISLVWWPGYCRLTRATVLAVKEQAFVEAARTLGAPEARIILRHVLPNAISPIVVKASMDFGFAVLTTASLGFIGLGAQPPTPDWGKMLADGRRYLPESWWYSTFPGLAIFLTVLGFNLLGDGLRDILDPRLRFRGE